MKLAYPARWDMVEHSQLFGVIEFFLCIPMIDKRFKTLRSSVRKAGKEIIRNILDNHFDPNNFAGLPDTCIFCNSSESLTREHVIPKWVFENSTKSYFVTTSNQISQSFHRTTVPACSECNNSYLGYIERYICEILAISDFEKQVEVNDLINIIRWLEIIEYKFHVLEFRRKYKASKSEGYEPILAEVPISIWRRNIRYSPYKAVAELRQSQKRITVKNKESRFDSLIIFGSEGSDLHFCHTMNEYIYLGIPQFKKHLFYFFNRKFEHYSDAVMEARRIIKEVYSKESSSDQQ